MPQDLPIKRRRLAAAIAISLLLHGGFVGSWFAARDDKPSPIAGSPTGVDAPDDRELVITMTAIEVRSSSKPIDATIPPAPLPPTIVAPKSVASAPSALVHAGNQSVPGVAVPTASGTPALHGKMKSGKSIAYVIDRSSSMGADGMLNRAMATLLASLEQLDTETYFQIVAYNGGVRTMANRPLRATLENREQAAKWLRQLQPEGRSNHVAGVRESLWQKPDAVFLLTDADDLDDKEARSIRTMLRTPVHFSAAVFGTRRVEPTTPLARLCMESGGHVTPIGR